MRTIKSRLSLASIVGLSACAAVAVSCAVPAARAQTLPSCKSEPTRTTFINAVNNSPAARVGGLEALNLRYSLEVYTSNDGTVRMCEGQAVLNVGERDYYMLLELNDDGTMDLTTMSERAIMEKGQEFQNDPIAGPIIEDAIRSCIKHTCRPNDGRCVMYCDDETIMKIE